MEVLQAVVKVLQAAIEVLPAVVEVLQAVGGGLTGGSKGPWRLLMKHLKLCSISAAMEIPTRKETA